MKMAVMRACLAIRGKRLKSCWRRTQTEPHISSICQRAMLHIQIMVTFKQVAQNNLLLFMQFYLLTFIGDCGIIVGPRPKAETRFLLLEPYMRFFYGKTCPSIWSVLSQNYCVQCHYIPTVAAFILTFIIFYVII